MFAPPDHFGGPGPTVGRYRQGPRASQKNHWQRGQRAREDETSKASLMVEVGMKTDRIRTNITDIIFVFIFLVGFIFEYG